MARKGKIQRNSSVLSLVEAHAQKRSVFSSILKSKTASFDEKFTAMVVLQKFPRNGSSVRYRNRCKITGRPRGYYGAFGLCRNMIRHYASFGMIHGLKKSSW